MHFRPVRRHGRPCANGLDARHKAGHDELREIALINYVEAVRFAFDLHSAATP
jgi:hypothetical protein